MYKIGKAFTFEAGHHLPHHDGKCREPHGHGYKVEIVLFSHLLVEALNDPKEGMLLDFGILTDVWKERIFSKVDHTNLNESAPRLALDYDLHFGTTTAENLARLFFEIVSRQRSPESLSGALYSVKVWETATSWAEYIREDTYR